MNIQTNPQSTALYLHSAYGWTVFDIAQMLGVCPQQVIAWLKGSVVE